MSFDIPHFHIPDSSPEAQVVEMVMADQKLTAEEAILTILRNAQGTMPERNFIKEGRGMFKDPEDAKLLDEALAISLEERRRPSRQKLE
jgi:hypothetical protein